MAMRVALVMVCACGGNPAAPDAAIDAPSAPPAKLVAYISGAAPNIAWDAVDRTTGALTPSSSIAAFQNNPSFLAIDPTAHFLYAVSEGASRVGAHSIDPATGALTFLNDVGSSGTGPAHLSVDHSGKFVFVANYTNGAIAVFPIQTGGALGAAQQTLAAGVKAHMIVSDPSGRFVFVPCLGSNYVAQFTFDATTGTLTPNSVPHLVTATGAGPRHLAFAPNGPYAYLINETNSTMSALALDGSTGRLRELQTLSTRAAGATGANTTAEVWVHPSGKFVYGSNRGDDNIVTYSLDSSTGMLALVGHTSTQGMTPRDFTLDPSGSFLYAANQNSNSVVPFAIDPSTGTPSPVAAPVTATSPTFVGIIALP